MPPARSFSARRAFRTRSREVLPAPDPVSEIPRRRGRPRTLVAPGTPPAAIPLPPQPDDGRRELAGARLLARAATHGTASPYGSRQSRQLCLRYVMTDPIGFRRFMIPKITPMGYWHRYSFSPVILGMRQGDTVLKAGRGTGKCAEINTLLMDVRTGLRRPLSTWSAGDVIAGVSGKAALVTSPVQAYLPSGHQACVEVALHSGRRIVLTPEHPLLTVEGWRAVTTLHPGDAVATPVGLPHPTEPVALPDAVVDLLAILLAEGSLTAPSVQFTKPNAEIQAMARAAAEALDCDLHRLNARGLCSIVRRDPRAPHPVRTWADQAGLQWVTSPQRRVPPAIFRVPAAQLARFLAVYWMCDGHVDRRQGTPQLVVASRGLAEDIQHLLLRFRIQSRVCYKAARCGSKTFDAWRLTVYSTSIGAFAALGLWGEAQQRLVRQQALRQNPNVGAAPAEASLRALMSATWSQRAPIDRRAARAFVVDRVPVSHQRDPMRPFKERTTRAASVRAWAEALGLDAEAVLVGSPDLWWDPIVSITPVGTQAVADLSVPETENFVAADIVIHNSFAVLEPELVQFAITHPGEESMLTTLRKIHIVDRMERVIEMLMTPVLKKYVKTVKRYPQYLVETHGGHKLYGISVGDDPEAKMAQGKHAALLAGEEFHQYPNRAWIKLQGAKHAQGCRVALFGVPDGRLETPYRLADTKYRAFEGRRFWISRHMDPHFNQKTKAELIDVHGGETSDLYLQEVHAKWGSPVWSAWSMDMLYRCMQRKELPIVVRLDYRQYREQELQPSDAVLDIPELPMHADDVVLAADIGYTQPTEAGVFWRQRLGDHCSAWVLHCRLELINRFEHNVQAEILWALAKHVHANTIGIDCTEGEGRAIAVEIDELAHSEITTRVGFSDLIEVEEEMPDGRIERHEEPAKALATRLLRAMFANQSFDMARDEQIVAEFDQERESKTALGARSIKTPGTVHIPEMFRVLVLTLHFRSDSDEASSQILMPQIGWDESRLGVA